MLRRPTRGGPALAVALHGAGAGFAVPSSARPIVSSGAGVGFGSPIVEARSTRRERPMTRSNRAIRMRDKTRSSQAGHARNPNRISSRQNQGRAKGGPRY